MIAGISGTAVHRLTQTREMLPHQVQKQFMRLEILMGTQKSHFAYRLAWSNTSTERIPFLALHRRDLLLAEEGNRTFIGHGNKRINWKKIEVIGDILVGIQRSQRIPYHDIPRNEEVQRLLLDTKFTTDDDVSELPLLLSLISEAREGIWSIYFSMQVNRSLRIFTNGAFIWKYLGLERAVGKGSIGFNGKQLRQNWYC